MKGQRNDWGGEDSIKPGVETCSRAQHTPGRKRSTCGVQEKRFKSTENILSKKGTRVYKKTEEEKRFLKKPDSLYHGKEVVSTIERGIKSGFPPATGIKSNNVETIRILTRVESEFGAASDESKGKRGRKK